ncbi:ATP-binding cassette domain-containing protein [Klebsiella pneumoniae]|uniref:ATP-binding cassette domain-containing protein n=1 Tax=Klebsiella pneumoniae TaxID=573 RepID=UPI000E3EE3C1|nr:ATP-binding cassette domain-containing protein [Klebsiella pneumoniae]
MPAENILEVHHLKKSVGQGEHQLSILTGVELVVKPRQTIALIGESGSGKSTLLAILAGLDDGSSGEVSMLGKPLHRMEGDARALLEQLGLGKRLHHLPAQLSGGEQQRVALARAFNGRPAILFADEPTGNLDRQTGDKIADLLFSLNREHGTTLILVTHDPLLAARCDRRLRLVDGQLREEA